MYVKWQIQILSKNIIIVVKMDKKIIIANWKMHGTHEFINEFILQMTKFKNYFNKCDVIICPPFTLLYKLQEISKYGMFLGAQDCHFVSDYGAYTGDINAAMLKSEKCSYIIVGHSERRNYHQENSKLVAEKVTAIHKEGMIAVVCVGESQTDRDQGQAYSAVYNQLKESLPPTVHPMNTIIAYEPVWAIGTGIIPSVLDIMNMHKFIGEKINNNAFEKKYKLIYGGSVKADNADNILSINNVDGLLVGGASLNAEEFSKIIQNSIKNIE
ncbi:Triosephosphate isomerase [Rickettsiales bacterium Ac37b]|nr:Triosephosphate isomerase [Rickettsiales bacterium Ac37b]